jgi:hypothetical protein
MQGASPGSKRKWGDVDGDGDDVALLGGDYGIDEDLDAAERSIGTSCDVFCLFFSFSFLFLFLFFVSFYVLIVC